MIDKVIDASALAALVFGEAAADDIVQRIGNASLAAPRLIEFELGNVCWKKCRREPALTPVLIAAFADMYRLDLRFHDVDGQAVLALAQRLALTFYDASYLWLARHLGIPLLSLDARLIAASAQ